MKQRFVPPVVSLLLVLFSLVLPGLAGGPTPHPDRWLSLTGEPAGTPATVTPLRWTGRYVDLEVRVPGIAYGKLAGTKGGDRTVLEIPGGGLVAELGAPRLPVVRKMIEVPPGARVRLTVTPLDERTISLEELGVPAKVLPVQPPVPKIPGADRLVPWRENGKIYGSNRPWPAEPGRVVDRAVVRGRHVVLVEARPVRYEPAKGVLHAWSRARVTLEIEGGSRQAMRRNHLRHASPALDRSLREAILSPPEPPGPAPSAPRGEAGGAAEGAEGMVVVVYDGFADAIRPLVDWKRRQGFKVEVIRTSDLGSDPTDQDVKNALQQRYDTWSNPSLGWVLMVGDTDFTPIHWGNGGGNSQVTDNWYACLDGDDYLPDVEIARISTRTAEETQNVVDKLLLYEKATFTATTWIKKAGFIGTSDSGHIDMIEGTHDWCIDTFYTPNDYLQTNWSHGKESCDRHYHTYDADTSEIRASIDEGRAIVNYSGHGSETSWQGPTDHGGYDQDDVRSNTNDGMYPFVISNACVTGTLNRDECFGETWQKLAHKGAIAFLGASNSSYWDEDDYFQRRLHTHTFPMDDTPAIATINRLSKMDLYDHYGDTGTVQYYFEMYNLLAEPSLSLWTRAPRDWDVSYDDSLPIGESHFTVTVSWNGQPVEGALVAVQKEDEGVFESGYTDANGEVTLVLDPAPQQVGDMLVTVTKHDFRPHLGSTQVISPDSPWLVHRSHEVDDTDGGDGDGVANPGETFTMPVTVENVGEQPGTGLWGQLRTTTPGLCEIVDDMADFPDLQPHEQGTSLPDHYRVHVLDGVPDWSLMGFELDWHAADGSSGTTSFSERVAAVQLDVDHYDIDDSEGGNGNGVAGPGETVDMTVYLANQGHRDARGIHGTLSCDSPYITILRDEADWPDIEAGKVQPNEPPPFRFSVADDAPDQQPVTFTLSVHESGSDTDWVLTFDVMISSCAKSDFSTDVPKDIEDNSTVESTLDYPNKIVISEVNVYVDISHTYIGDLRVIVQSPAGTRVVLHDRTGGSDDDIVTWYDTETEPAESLDRFNGENAWGTWKLIVEDHAGGDTGTLNNWRLEVCGDRAEEVPDLVVSGHAVDDGEACDPDGHADVGETVWYEVTIRNRGWGDATAVEASLSSDAKVAVLNNPVDLGTIPFQQEATARFRVETGAVSCMENAHFTVDMTSTEGTWQDGFDDVLEVDDEPRQETEDLEHGGAEPEGWSHSASQGTDDWGVADTKNHTGGGSWAWFVSDVDSTKEDSLYSREYTLADGATLEFWHFMDSESGYDGGVLEISDDGGATWTDLGPSITEGGYDRSFSGGPLSGRDGWTGEYTDWKHVVVDLSAWSGKTVKFRWHYACDSSSSRTGWWVDDIVVQSTEQVCDDSACGVPGEVKLTSVRKDADAVVLEWWSDPLCLTYQVWRASDPSAAENFSDVTGEDDDPADNTFRDTSGGTYRCWIVVGEGPDGVGPWGHYGR